MSERLLISKGIAGKIIDSHILCPTFKKDELRTFVNLNANSVKHELILPHEISAIYKVGLYLLYPELDVKKNFGGKKLSVFL